MDRSTKLGFGMSPLTRATLVVLVLGLVVGGLALSAEYNDREAQRRGKEQAERIMAPTVARVERLNQSMTMLDPTAEQWRTADNIDRIDATLTWADGVAPNAPNEQIIQFQQCIDDAARDAPANTRVRGSIAAPCAATLGW